MEINFQISQKFDTISCWECGWESLIFLLQRLNDESSYEEEEVGFWNAVNGMYCPMCGEKIKYPMPTVKELKKMSLDKYNKDMKEIIEILEEKEKENES